ncbi:acetolactate synthase [Moorena producens PAL-8-15-08-1]|uniref:Acetolactate synthase n=1 Tax=Moorena producens PAL-8-15-08-1 TaxID=1458985 RepID=A0A1D8TZL7_9CYAN|nr:ScyA-related TPP-binding enzyme [Moorena producens]AOX03088.1 acetolactate synthase [Moorena producens PAL-8-15-08-1]
MKETSILKSISEAVVEMLLELGVKYAFGVSGGAIASLWTTLEQSPIEVLHFRHESGAAFAATEAYLASERPVVVFTTTGPGITNVLTGIMAARSEGAKIILLSGFTSIANRGRWACQETSAYTMSGLGFFTSGQMFHYATVLESSDQLPEIARRLTIGMAKPEGFVSHMSIPTDIQTNFVTESLPHVSLSLSPPTAGEEIISECVQLLSEGSFAIWVGFGARGAASEIRQFAERTAAAVMCSPRGKGIFPEDHPQFIGVTGLSGHDSVMKYMQEKSPLRILVLGTRLGETTSFWSSLMVPERGFIHVDLNPDVPGSAYPSAETFSIHSELKIFLKALLEKFPLAHKPNIISLPCPQFNVIDSTSESPVRPEVLMNVIQQMIVVPNNANAIIMAEAGNSFAWTTHLLQFTQPRYRISTNWGAMGHMTTGVLGAALAGNCKAVAIVGDGAMLMNNEINTAVKYGIPAVWIVLNDACYNMCEQGNALRKLKGADTQFPQADFVAIANGMGADGIRVKRESDLQPALEVAMASTVPFLVDVIIDPSRTAPIGSRVLSLMSQDNKS